MIKTKHLNKKDLIKLKQKDKILIRYKNGFIYLLEIDKIDDKYILCRTPNMGYIQLTHLNKDGKYDEYIDDIVQIF